MIFDQTKRFYIYPSWASYSFGWEQLPTLLPNVEQESQLKRKGYDWKALGYSQSTDNFELIPGPFGNGIIVCDRTRMTDAKKPHMWLPAIYFLTEAYERIPPGLEEFQEGFQRQLSFSKTYGRRISWF